MPGPFFLGPFVVGIGRAAGADIGIRMKEFLDKAVEGPASGAPPTVEELLALERMRRKRLCPDRSKLLAGGAAVQRHLEYCEACRERLNSASRTLKLTGLPKLAVLKNATPEARQVRDVRKSASGMADVSSDEWLFNPPMVLVIQAPDAGKLFVRVAQMHDESELAGPGDISVQMPDGVLYIESWNTYPLLSKYLGPVLGTVDPEIVKLVLKNEKKEPSAVPEDSPLESFRELETRISYFFCQDSVHQILSELNEKESRKKGKAKVLPFVQPTYDGKRDYWNDSQFATAASQIGYGFPLVACLAGACYGLLFDKEKQANASEGNDTEGVSDAIKKQDKKEKADEEQEALEPLRKYVKDAFDFREKAENLYSEHSSGGKSTKDAIKETDILLINAEKAANAVLYLAGMIAEKVNCGEIDESILSEALELAKKAREEVAKIKSCLNH